MKNENIYFIILVCLLDNLKLFDFGLKQSENNNLLNSINHDFTDNHLLDFVLTWYNHAKVIIPKYFHENSKI